jgi:hypothetical protein
VQRESNEAGKIAKGKGEEESLIIKNLFKEARNIHSRTHAHMSE